MKRFCFLLLISLIASQAFATDEQTLRRLTEQALSHLHDLDLEKAAVKFDSLLLLAPKDPRGALLKAAHAYLLFIDDTRNNEVKKSLQKWIDKSIKLSESKLARDRDNPEYLNYLGLSYMYQAGLHAVLENYLRTFYYIRNGIKTLKAAVAFDSTYYDAYLGLGVFHYHADILPKFMQSVTALFGLEADRSAGLREMKLVQEKGRYLKEVGAVALGDVYINFEKKFEDALHIFEEMSAKYPGNVFYRLYLARCYRRTGHPRQALEAYKTMLKNQKDALFPNMNRAAYYWSGDVYFGLNQFDQASAYYDSTIQVFGAPEKGKYHWAYAYGNYKKGLCLELSGSRTQAEVFYKNVRKKDSKTAFDAAKERLKKPMLAVDIDLRKGRNFFGAKMYDEAFVVFNKALSGFSRDEAQYPPDRRAEVFYNLAKIKFEQKAYNEAIRIFQSVIETPKVEGKWLKPWARFRMGECYARLGDTKTALALFEKAHEFDDPDLRFEIRKARESAGSNAPRSLQ